MIVVFVCLLGELFVLGWFFGCFAVVFSGFAVVFGIGLLYAITLGVARCGS